MMQQMRARGGVWSSIQWWSTLCWQLRAHFRWYISAGCSASRWPTTGCSSGQGVIILRYL